jgi:hypothetical protein
MGIFCLQLSSLLFTSLQLSSIVFVEDSESEWKLEIRKWHEKIRLSAMSRTVGSDKFFLPFNRSSFSLSSSFIYAESEYNEV